MQNLSSGLRRTRTFPEYRKTCGRTARRAPALTLRSESEGATGAGWGAQGDDTEARNKIPTRLFYHLLSSMVFIHFLSYWQTSTRGAQGAVNGKATRKPWLGERWLPRAITFPVTKAGGWEAALGSKVNTSALNGSPGVPRTGNIHFSQGNRQKVPERQGEWSATSFSRNNFCHC